MDWEINVRHPQRTATDRDVSGNGDAMGPFITSVDPGKEHCAMVCYNTHQDRFTHAVLLNLLCRCDRERRGRGPLESAWDDTPAVSTRTLRPASVYDYPAQLMTRFDPLLFPQGLFEVAIERQNARDTGNMVVQAVLQTHFADLARLHGPREVKRFWNAEAAALAQSPCFRLQGSHSKNKTDAKRMGARILDPRERTMFRIAAERNHAHGAVCPSMRARNRKRKHKTAVKTDDLLDAALQAIYAAQRRAADEPGDPRAPAARRLLRTAVKPEPKRRRKKK